MPVPTRPPTGQVKQPLIYWQPIAGAGLVVLIACIAIVFCLRDTPRAEAAEAPDDRSLAVTTPETSTPVVASTPAEAETPRVERAALEPIAPLAEEPRAAVKDTPALEPETAVKGDAAPGITVAELSIPVPVPAVREVLVPAPPPAIVREDKDHDTFGTSISFCRNVALAREEAKNEKKLFFILHVSGNFEDTEFT